VWGYIVTKEDEYVANALKSLELAERAASPIDQRRLLNLGERWLDLADRIHHRRPHSRGLPEHPLVKVMFSRERREA
jgi:hypothetical protein